MRNRTRYTVELMSERTRWFQALDQPQKRGQATESVIKSEFTIRDVPVLVPEYDNEPYDFVIEIENSFYKIQSKTAYEGKEGTVQFETVSTRTRSTGYERDSYDGKIDYFAVYNPIVDEIYLVHIDEAAKGKMEIRLCETKNNQTAGINWNEDFQLDAKLRQLSSAGDSSAR